MAPTPITENLVAANKEYAASFTQGHLALPPAKKYAVGMYLIYSCCLLSDISPVTCMDARIDPAAAYGIALGDAHVIRNGEHPHLLIPDFQTSRR